jgi:hypothetical protein
MQDRPDPSTLLDGVAQFLMTEVLPKIEDKALAFRVMIAANLSTVVSAGLRSEDERVAAEAKRLQLLLPEMVVAGESDAAALPTRKQRSEAVAKLNRELARRLREGGFDAEQLGKVQEHVKKTALEALAVVNPRFDTSEEIE